MGSWCSSDGRFRVFTYNILAENYATQERHPYVPYWALEWEYRKQRILKQLLSYKADVICLQEVESKQYHEYFEPELAALGYASIFRAKSRARTMADSSVVDGCATFFLKAKCVSIATKSSLRCTCWHSLFYVTVSEH